MVGDRGAPIQPLGTDAPAKPVPTPPPPADKRALAFAGLLFLGSLVAVVVGLAVTLARQIRKKGRRKGATVPRKDR